MKSSKCLLLKNNKIIMKELKIEDLRKFYKIPEQYWLVKSLYTGVCGSDLHKIRIGSQNERILGHECLVEFNNKVYAVNPLLPCEKCEMCKKGYENLCEKMKTIGFDFPGGFCEYFFVPKQNLYKVENSPIYVLLDAFVSVYHGIKNIEQLLKSNNSDEALIIGDGIIALFSAFFCSKYLHFERIRVIGKHRKRLQAFNEIVKNIETTLLNESESRLGKDKFPFTIEAVGGKSVEPFLIAINLTKSRGILLSYGVFDPNKLYEFPLRRVLEKELTLIGSKSYTSKEFMEGLRLFNAYKKELNFLEKYLKIDKPEIISRLLNQSNSWKENFLKLVINWGEDHV